MTERRTADGVSVQDFVRRAKQKWKTWLPSAGELGVGWSETYRVTRTDTARTKYGPRLCVEFDEKVWLPWGDGMVAALCPVLGDDAAHEWIGRSVTESVERWRGRHRQRFTFSLPTTDSPFSIPLSLSKPWNLRFQFTFWLSLSFSKRRARRGSVLTRPELTRRLLR